MAQVIPDFVAESAAVVVIGAAATCICAGIAAVIWIKRRIFG